MYRTGDLAIYNENNLLIFCGRKDNQIKHLGYRIELGEIETATLSLKEIDNCMSFYDSAKRNIVLLYVSNNEDFDSKKLKLALTNILPKYMVPTKYYQLEELPINTNGKIDRMLLKKQYS